MPLKCIRATRVPISGGRGGAMSQGGTFGEKKEYQMVFHEWTWS